MNNPYSLEGKTILVTGASSGIGRATAIECSKLGAKVILTARNEERLKETLSMLSGEGHSYVICDLTDSQAISEMVAGLPEVHGLVNNAGFSITAPIPFIKEDKYLELLKVNTMAPIILLSMMVKKKVMKRGSSCVFVGSVSGLGKTSVGNSMYASTKGAINAFSMAAAKELADKGIRVNSVCAGMVETNITSNLSVSEEQLEADKASFPLKRYGKPEEVAWAIIYLMSDAAAWVTGSDLVIDGGRMLK